MVAHTVAECGALKRETQGTGNEARSLALYTTTTAGLILLYFTTTTTTV